MIRKLAEGAAGPFGGILDRFEFHDCNNALSVLPTAIRDELVAALQGVRLTETDLLAAGGGKSSVATTIETGLRARGWMEKKFRLTVGDYLFETHRIDCCKGQFAVEIEWNNKDTFFDRDLAAFRLLHETKHIGAAVILTRSSALQQRLRGMAATGRISADKFVSTTTHMDRLLPRLAGRIAGKCPVLAIGILPGAFLAATGREDDPLFVFGDAA